MSTVDTKHEQYTDNVTTWKFLRDSVEGSKAIKAGGTTYVPSLDGQTDTEYKAMANRPSYENFTQRTLDGLTGLIFSKEPIFTAPKALMDLKENIDAQGKTLTDLAQETVEEVETVGRVGLLVDAPSVDVAGMTEADAEALNLRPFIRMYATESIINWKHEIINNQQVLSMVVLMEEKDEWVDMFTNKPKTFYRVLHLVEGVYTQTIFEEVAEGTAKTFIQGDIVQPRIKGKALSSIPFIPITPTSLEITPAKSPLYDLADVNLTHFKTNVDYYHGMHFTALPTGWGAGVQMKDGDSIALGGSKFHLFDNPQAKLEFLEFKGDGLGTLEREKKELKSTMTILGANLLTSDKNVAEAENTVAMRSAGERATLVSIANTCSRGIKSALDIMAEWLGTSGEVSYKLNTDYQLTEMNPQMIKALVETWQMGGLSQEDIFLQFQKGEIVSETENYEEWQAKLEVEAPLLSAPPETEKNNSTLDAIRNKLGL